MPFPIAEASVEVLLDRWIDPERAPDGRDANVVPVELGEHLGRGEVADTEPGERCVDKVRDESAMRVVREDRNVGGDDLVRLRLGAQPPGRDMNPRGLGLQPAELTVLLVRARGSERGGAENE